MYFNVYACMMRVSNVQMFYVREGTVWSERLGRDKSKVLLSTWYSVSLRKRTPQVGIHCEIRDVSLYNIEAHSLASLGSIEEIRTLSLA